MTAEILIVTYARDFRYLPYCLRSIVKFAEGFRAVRLLVPHEDVEGALAIVKQTDAEDFPTQVVGYSERPGKGMLWHMRQIMYADEWSSADIIGHLDADCVFDSPVSPEADWLTPEGKIILRYEPFSSICKRHDAMSRWQDCTQKILPFQVKHETMRAHPEVYHRTTYQLARSLVERKTNIRIDEYILSCENAFPQTFCEHVTLGNVALEKQPNLYEGVYQKSDCPTPDNKVFQAWSHGDPGEPQDLWYKGKQERFVPIEMFNKILGRFVPTAEENERMVQ
jgi:hypothetical protein